MSSDADRHARGDQRARELASRWRTSLVLWWDDGGRARVLAGPTADALPAGATEVHWVTAQDPAGRTPPPERNARLLEDLLAWAARASAEPGARWRWWPSVGASSTDDHAELGILVAGVGRAAALALGEELEQLAIYEATVEDLRIVRCRDGEVTDAIARCWPQGAPRVDLGPERLARWWAPLAAALPPVDDRR